MIKRTKKSSTRKIIRGIACRQITTFVRQDLLDQAEKLAVNDQLSGATTRSIVETSLQLFVNQKREREE